MMRISMKTWEEDLLSELSGLQTPKEVFECIKRAALRLGFEYCTYGLRAPLPLTNLKTTILSNYPREWQTRYEAEGFVNVDPTVLHCRQHTSPIIWSDEVFSNTPELWEEAKKHGLRFGWAKSSLDTRGIGGMLTLARCNDPITEKELELKSWKMQWLAHITHLSLSGMLSPLRQQLDLSELTGREIEILKWTADGKTSSEISQILLISENTVNFHIKNAIAKLQSPNKTAAAVRAAMLGLLS